MPALFDALPGLEVPVGGISDGFTRLWADSPAKDSRAVQLNLVLHFGANATPDDALAQFRTTLRLAQRHPCRVVLLCPDLREGAPPEMRAKIYAECFLGKSPADKRCVEFVVLHYTMSVRQHLENQVSVCLSADMPLYYWAHRFGDIRRLAGYNYLLTRSERVLFDSALVPADAFTHSWPNLAAVRDLAYTRTRPLRQTIGQFLSRYAPARIVGGLREVTIGHRPELAAEAAAMLSWVRKGLVRCGAPADGAGIRFDTRPGAGAGSFQLGFSYGDPARQFRWEADLATGQSTFAGDLGDGRTTLAALALLLEPDAALAEAMFH